MSRHIREHKMKNLIAMTLMLAVMSGCTETQEVAKVKAKERWELSRAQVIYGVGMEHLKVGQLDQAYGKAQESLALAPDFQPARILLAKVYIEQGNYSDAATELKTVCDKAPQAAEPVYLLGVAQEKMQQYDQALASYRKAYALDNSRLEAVKAAAEVLILTDRIEEARTLVASCISRAGTDPALYETAGRIAMIQKDYTQAARFFLDAHDLDFQNLRYREVLAEAQYLSGQYADAADTLKQLLAVKDYVGTAVTYSRMGDCNMAVGDYVEARNAYYKATELSPNNAGVWVNLAQAALALKDNDRAIASARTALTVEAGNLDATLILAYGLLKNNKADQAIEILQKSATFHADSAQLQLVLGRALQAAGQKDKAQAAFNKALALEPENKLAKELAKTTDDMK